MLSRLKFLFYFLVASAIFLFLPTKIFAANLLTNSGFEDGISSWSKYGGTLEIFGDSVHGGTEAARLTSTTASTKWIYQIVSVVGGTAYVFSGYLVKNNANITSVLLRIAWYNSSDGSGSELSHTDSSSLLTDDSAEYRLLSTGSIVAPDDAHSVRAKTVVAFSSTAQTSAFFDDFIFEETALPTPTPIPTPTPTSTMTNTPTPTPTPTPKPPTSTPTPKVTPTLTSVNSSATQGGEILGEETNASLSGEILPTATPQAQVQAFTSENILPKILIGVGILFLLISGGSLLLPKIRRYNVKDEEASDLE